MKTYGKRNSFPRDGSSTVVTNNKDNDIFTTITTSPESQSSRAFIPRDHGLARGSSLTTGVPSSSVSKSVFPVSSSLTVPHPAPSSFSSSSSSVPLPSLSIPKETPSPDSSLLPPSSEPLLRRPMKGLLGRLRIREEGRTLYGGGNGGGDSSPSTMKLYTTVPQRQRYTVASLLQRIPLLQECILLGFSKDGIYLYSYSFDQDLRLQFQIWRWNGPYGLTFTHTTNTSSSSSTVRTVDDYVKLVKKSVPLQLHATVPLFPHIDFTVYSSSIGSFLLDGTYIRITFWEAADQGCLIIFGNLSEKFLALGTNHLHNRSNDNNHDSFDNDNSVDNLNSIRNNPPSSTVMKNKPVGQMYHITIIPAIPNSIPSLVSTSSSSNSSSSPSFTNDSPSHGTAPPLIPWLSTDSSFLSSTNRTNTINAFHFSYPVSPPYPRPSIIGFECIRSSIDEDRYRTMGEHELSMLSFNSSRHDRTKNTTRQDKTELSSSPSLCSNAQNLLRSLHFTNLYRLVLNSGDSVRCLTFGVRKVGLLVPSLPSSPLPNDSFSSSLFYTPSPWYSVASLCSFATMRDRVSLHPHDSLSSPDRCTCPENCMLNTKNRSSATTVRIPQLINARYTLSERSFAEQYVRTHHRSFVTRHDPSSFLSSSSTDPPSATVSTTDPFYSQGLWNTVQGIEILRNPSDERSFMGAVGVLSHTVVDIGTLLQRCIRGRIQNYDSRLVRMMDTAETELFFPPGLTRTETMKKDDEDDEKDKENTSPTEGNGAKHKRIREQIDTVPYYPDLSVTEGSKVRDARYALLCCLVDHVLPLVNNTSNGNTNNNGSNDPNESVTVSAILTDSTEKATDNSFTLTTMVKSQRDTTVFEIVTGDKTLLNTSTDTILTNNQERSQSSSLLIEIGNNTNATIGKANTVPWRSSSTVYGRSTSSNGLPAITDDFWDMIDKEKKQSLLSSTVSSNANSPKDNSPTSTESSLSSSSSTIRNHSIWLSKLTPPSSSPTTLTASVTMEPLNTNILHTLIKSGEIRKKEPIRVPSSQEPENVPVITTTSNSSGNNNENDVSTITLSAASSDKAKDDDEHSHNEDTVDHDATMDTDNESLSSVDSTASSTTGSTRGTHPRVRITEAPLTRSKILYVIDLLSPTGSVRVLSVTRMSPQYQPAFDRSTNRTLTSLTSQITTILRQQAYVPVHPSQYPREFNNDSVLTGKSLSHIINPELPVAIVI